MTVSLVRTNYGWGTLDGNIVDDAHAKTWFACTPHPAGLNYMYCALVRVRTRTPKRRWSTPPARARWWLTGPGRRGNARLTNICYACRCAVAARRSPAH